MLPYYVLFLEKKTTNCTEIFFFYWKNQFSIENKLNIWLSRSINIVLLHLICNADSAFH